MHPADMPRARARATAIWSRVESRRGAIVVPVDVGRRCRPGQAYLPMHWGTRTLGGRAAAPASTRSRRGRVARFRGSPSSSTRRCASRSAELPWRLDRVRPGVDATRAASRSRDALRALRGGVRLCERRADRRRARPVCCCARGGAPIAPRDASTRDRRAVRSRRRARLRYDDPRARHGAPRARRRRAACRRAPRGRCARRGVAARLAARRTSDVGAARRAAARAVGHAARAAAAARPHRLQLLRRRRGGIGAAARAQLRRDRPSALGALQAYAQVRHELRLVPARAQAARGSQQAGGVTATRQPRAVRPESRAAWSLVGAGPGDPELLTLKAVRALARADVSCTTTWSSDGVLALCAPGARIVAVGKRGGCRRRRRRSSSS